MTTVRDERLPTFLVIGASKTGTTSLHHYLSQHPDIYMSPEKEPGFFLFEGKPAVDRRLRDRPFVSSLTDYQCLFKGAQQSQRCGECSTYYLDLATPDVVARIRALIPDVRLIAIFRQPVDHAYSRYISLRRDGQLGDIGFAELMQHDLRNFDDLDYAKSSYRFVSKSYAKRLKLFVEAFPREQMMLSLYDDYHHDQYGFLGRSFAFLGVDPDFSPDMSDHYNLSGLHRSASVAYLLNRPNPVRLLARQVLPEPLRHAGRRWLQVRNRCEAPTLDADLRATLTRQLGAEIDALEDLLDRDLSHWHN